MGLIQCPDCGQNVSDKAKTCIHCGCPLKNDGKVIIKYDFPAMNQSHFLGKSRCFLYLAETDALLGECRYGETICIEIDKPIKVYTKVHNYKQSEVLEVNPNDRFVVRQKGMWGKIDFTKVGEITF